MTSGRVLKPSVGRSSSRLPAAQDGLDPLRLLAERCIEATGVAAAGVLVGDMAGQLRVVATTSDAVHITRICELQRDQGPCQECFHSGEPVAAPDLADADARWPRFAPAARRAGFTAGHALPLRLDGTVVGALGLLHTTSLCLSTNAQALGQVLADAAAIVVVQQQTVMEAQHRAAQLETALESRVVIEQAKGVISQHSGIAMEEAFRRLRGYARSHQRLLHDVARDVAEQRVSAASLNVPQRAR